MSQGWEIREVRKSERNGCLQVCGINHETTDPLFREFSWHVQSVTADARYWLAPGAVISPNAHSVLERLGWPRRGE